MRVEFGSKSGLAFSDKLFCFIGRSSRSSISAIMTHEYNHVCRLENMPKEEKKMTLLDTIILEGLAEYAVSNGWEKPKQPHGRHITPKAASSFPGPVRKASFRPAPTRWPAILQYLFGKDITLTCSDMLSVTVL
ncbi:DUF2268 domain-containing putative Zn-dependent protease [Bacillus licheniformis]|nr:DUF2268 domain-containing putative Zn-dependent protease [Bacillus licheniformis]